MENQKRKVHFWWSVERERGNENHYFVVVMRVEKGRLGSPGAGPQNTPTQNTESFPAKYDVSTNIWLFAQSRQPGRKLYSDLDDQVHTIQITDGKGQLRIATRRARRGVGDTCVKPLSLVRVPAEESSRKGTQFTQHCLVPSPSFGVSTLAFWSCAACLVFFFWRSGLLCFSLFLAFSPVGLGGVQKLLFVLARLALALLVQFFFFCSGLWGALSKNPPLVGRAFPYYTGKAPKIVSHCRAYSV